MTTEQIQIKRDDLLPGDVVITSNQGNPWIEVEREVPPVEGTIARFYNQNHVLLKRGRTRLALQTTDSMVEKNDELLWVNLQNHWGFRQYKGTLDYLEPEIVFTPEVTKENS